MTVTVKDFYADWCGPCESQEQILEEVEQEYDDVEFERIDADEHQDIANEYQVRSLPTLVIERDGEMTERFVGVTQAGQIEEAVQTAQTSAKA
ncbi:MAG: thioredoxin domain-containing protein [halophilic archaeon J07HX5]|jgi:Thioredoxin domain-containing protein|nr:MAG: thioredoxin domain-containing protein [halophilic archaeon J07HX5]